MNWVPVLLTLLPCAPVRAVEQSPPARLAARSERPAPDPRERAQETVFLAIGGGLGYARHDVGAVPVFDTAVDFGWRFAPHWSVGLRLALHGTFGVGFGLGGGMAEVRYFMPVRGSRASAYVGLAGGYTAGGSGTFVTSAAGRLVTGARFDLSRRFFAALEAEAVLTQYSLAGLGVAVLGVSF